MTVKIACLQMNSGPDVSDNLSFIEQHARLAASQGVKILQLPENYAQMPANAKQQVMEVDKQGEIQQFLSKLASSSGLSIIAGALPVRDTENSVQNPYARCLVFDQHGARIAHYDKIHLFNVQLPDGGEYRESDRFSPADFSSTSLVVSEIASVQVGLSICYDLRFPEQYRKMAEQGAQLLSVPSAFTYETGEAHWFTLLRARAIENLCYVFAAAQTGVHASGRRTWGHSLIIDPWGEVLAQARAGQLRILCVLHFEDAGIVDFDDEQRLVFGAGLCIVGCHPGSHVQCGTGNYRHDR